MLTALLRYFNFDKIEIGRYFMQWACFWSLPRLGHDWQWDTENRGTAHGKCKNCPKYFPVNY